MVKAVLFDLFETLVTQRDPYFHIRKRIGLHDILSVDEKSALRMFGETQRDRHEGRIRDRDEAFDRIASQYNLSIHRDALEAYYRQLDKTKTEAFSNIDHDVVRMLERLAEMKITKCVISNCEFFELKYYQQSCLPALVDHALFSCELGMAKPDATIFREALSRMGIGQNECIYIGDGGGSELQGATSAGIRAFQAYWYLKEYEAPFRKKKEQPFEKIHDALDVLCLLKEPNG